MIFRIYDSNFVPTSTFNIISLNINILALRTKKNIKSFEKYGTNIFLCKVLNQY